MLIIVLIILLLVCGFGGYRMGPGFGYYGGGGLSMIVGGGLSLIVLLLIIWLLLFNGSPAHLTFPR